MPAVDIETMEQIAEQFCLKHALTPREKEICSLICRGHKNHLIANTLGVSQATIRLHITNIHRKLHTANKVDLVLKIFDWWLAQCPKTAREFSIAAS